MNEIKKHFGVYAVSIKNNKLLCVKKTIGPYKNRYDLPGGSQEENESLIETLKREVKEEAGFDVVQYSNNRIYDSLVTPKGKETTVHHVFALYNIEVDELSKISIPKKVIDGMNDSDGFVFLDIVLLNDENVAPIILKLLQELDKSLDILHPSIYDQWTIKDNL